MDRMDEILPALQKHGNKTAAARALGMTDGAFRRRYDKLMLSGGEHYSVPDLPTGELDIEDLVASRKHRYARERGFRDQHISPCAVTVIDPDATEASFVQLFWEPEPAADYLTWLRQKRGVK